MPNSSWSPLQGEEGTWAVSSVSLPSVSTSKVKGRWGVKGQAKCDSVLAIWHWCKCLRLTLSLVGMPLSLGISHSSPRRPIITFPLPPKGILFQDSFCCDLPTPSWGLLVMMWNSTMLGLFLNPYWFMGSPCDLCSAKSQVHPSLDSSLVLSPKQLASQSFFL